MDAIMTPGDSKMIQCERCRRQIPADDVYPDKSMRLCEDCCLDLRISRKRKTHWQYVGSIKGDYLTPAGKSKRPCGGGRS